MRKVLMFSILAFAACGVTASSPAPELPPNQPLDLESIDSVKAQSKSKNKNQISLSYRIIAQAGAVYATEVIVESDTNPKRTGTANDVFNMPVGSVLTKTESGHNPGVLGDTFTTPITQFKYTITIKLWNANNELAAMYWFDLFVDGGFDGDNP